MTSGFLFFFAMHHFALSFMDESHTSNIRRFLHIFEFKALKYTNIIRSFK
jgi:hypothetical protein